MWNLWIEKARFNDQEIGKKEYTSDNRPGPKRDI